MSTPLILNFSWVTDALENLIIWTLFLEKIYIPLTNKIWVFFVCEFRWFMKIMDMGQVVVGIQKQRNGNWREDSDGKTRERERHYPHPLCLPHWSVHTG